MSPRKHLVCLSELLGVVSHEEVLDFFRKNKMKLDLLSTIPKILKKLRMSLEDETDSRWKAYHDYVQAYKDHETFMEKRWTDGKHLTWCSNAFFINRVCVCDNPLFKWPSNLIKEIIDVYYGVFTD